MVFNFSLPSLMNNEIWYPVSTNAHAYVKNMSKYRAALLKIIACYVILILLSDFFQLITSHFKTFPKVQITQNHK